MGDITIEGGRRYREAGMGAAAGFLLFLVLLLIAYIGVTYGLYDGDWGWITKLGGDSAPSAPPAPTCNKLCAFGDLNRSSCECVCDQGYYGDLCDAQRGTNQPPTIVCDPKDCPNGQQNPDTCECKCNQGFEKKLGVCVMCENACVNGARAADGCDCYCHPGWYGPACDSRDQTDNVQCDPSVHKCQYGTLRNDCSCECWPFYAGADCSQRDCSDVPCVNGDQDELCNCTCHPGWMGRACNEPLTPDCPSTVCYNGSVNSNCQCVCDPGFTGETCRIVDRYEGMQFDYDISSPEWPKNYNKCQQVPGAVWTGFQCMTVAGGCPMGDVPYQCVERGGYKYAHRAGDNDPWQCPLGDESNGGYIGDSVSYELGGRCLSAQSLDACDKVLDDMGCNRLGDGVCFSPDDPSCGSRDGIGYL